MERLSVKIVDILLKKHYIEESMYNIYKYGMQMTLEVGFSFITSVVICCLCDKVAEGVIFFTVFIPLRSFLGGFHMKSYKACYLFSCLTLIIALWISSFEVEYGISWLILSISIMVVFFEAKWERSRDMEGRHFYPRVCLTLFFILVAGVIFTILDASPKLFLLACTILLVAGSKLLENTCERLKG